MIKVSYFDNVEDTKPKDYDLEEWVRLTIEPTEDLEKKVERYRYTMDKKDKQSLPCITVSACFKDHRNLGNIVLKTNYLCLDVDRYSKSKTAKSNPCIDMLLVKEFFQSHPCTYYCGFSVSGEHFGCYAILRINNPFLFDQYFLYFEEKLNKLGINIDRSCKDPTRLRFFSVDKEAYYNPDALYYKMPSENEKEKEPTRHINISDKEKVDKIVEQIKRNSLDITGDYSNWIRLAAALYDLFGESGLDYFQTISQYHPEYNYQETEKKFNSCKKLGKTKINAFFGIAGDYGLRY